MADEAERKLDDPQTYSVVDASGLRHRLRGIPGQCLAAWESTRAVSWTEISGSGVRSSINKVVIGGMGGSAMAGDLAADFAAGKEAGMPGSSSQQLAKVPILVVRDVSFPFSLDQDTIFIACSYSGDTEETLALFGQALQANTRTMAISGGGKLSQLAEDSGVPLLKIDVASEPRTAVPYNLMLLLGVLRGLRLLDLDEGQVAGAISAVSQNTATWVEDVPLADNPAKKLASEIRDKLIFIYGSGLFSGMARRWKSQFNENSKTWAFFETLPELLHNSVEAFASPLGQPTMTLILEPQICSPIYGRHNRVILETLAHHNIPAKVIQGEGPSPLAQLLNMMLLGDYVSYYLALLRGVDPSPNPSIDAAKDLLSGLS